MFFCFFLLVVAKILIGSPGARFIASSPVLRQTLGSLFYRIFLQLALMAPRSSIFPENFHALVKSLWLLELTIRSPPLAASSCGRHRSLPSHPGPSTREISSLVRGESKNTEFVGELSKGRFCEGCRKWSCPLTGM